jgi:hypothetical protein
MDVDSKWSAASLRVFSSELTPEELAAALGVSPDRSYRAGDRVSLRSKSEAVHQSNAIFVNSGLPSDRPLEEHLAALVNKVERAMMGLRSLGGRVKADVFCGFSSRNGQGGFSLSPALLARLTALGLEIGFDLYPPASSESGEG